VPRGRLIALFALLALIWSSTWVAIKFGLEETPALLGAGVRFTLAGLLLFAFALAGGRRLRTDARMAAILALFPFALSYGLVYWGEQYIPSGLTAVLFGALPLWVALIVPLMLPSEPITPGVVVAIVVAVAGLAVAFGESLSLGSEDRALLGALALLASPLSSAIGNVSLKVRAGDLDAIVLNAWGMLGGGVMLLAASALGESWGDARWTPQAVAAIGYLAVAGTAVAFVGLTVLVRHVTAVTVSYISLVIPFGALVFGAVLYDEPITALSVLGAVLVGAGLYLAQRAQRQAAAAQRRARPDDRAASATAVATATATPSSSTDGTT
jgi:drug/metabolite transporter (DMT)-like permease